MIALLNGTVVDTALDSVTIVVGGIGWRVLVGGNTSNELSVGSKITLYTSLVVRDDSLSLYGFRAADERDIFDRLMSVSGIGPRIALAALSVLTPDELRSAITDSDTATLQRIPGVGKKSAQRMVLDIGDKLGRVAQHSGQVKLTFNATEEEVVAALVQLGWNDTIATSTVKGISPQPGDASSLLKAALLKLGGK